MGNLLHRFRVPYPLTASYRTAQQLPLEATMVKGTLFYPGLWSMDHDPRIPPMRMAARTTPLRLEFQAPPTSFNPHRILPFMLA